MRFVQRKATTARTVATTSSRNDCFSSAKFASTCLLLERKKCHQNSLWTRTRLVSRWFHARLGQWSNRVPRWLVSVTSTRLLLYSVAHWWEISFQCKWSTRERHHTATLALSYSFCQDGTLHIPPNTGLLNRPCCSMQSTSLICGASAGIIWWRQSSSQYLQLTDHRVCQQLAWGPHHPSLLATTQHNRSSPAYGHCSQ